MTDRYTHHRTPDNFLGDLDAFDKARLAKLADERARVLAQKSALGRVASRFAAWFSYGDLADNSREIEVHKRNLRARATMR